MSTIFMKRFDLENAIEEPDYLLPEQWRQGPNIRTLYPPIPLNTSAVDFDIYNFNMLFNDEKTKELLRAGRTIGCFYIESPGMRCLQRQVQ
jgi:hypothetical protein